MQLKKIFSEAYPSIAFLGNFLKNQKENNILFSF